MRTRARYKSLFEQSSDSFGESTTLEHKTPFIDNKEGDGTFIHPRLILRMRIEREEIWYTELRFESESQSNVFFANWASMLLTNPDFLRKFT